MLHLMPRPVVVALTALAAVFSVAMFAPQEVPVGPQAAQAAVTATIGGIEGGGAFTWNISYDDTTRAVTTTASGTGFCLVTVQITAAISRTVAYYPSQGATSQDPDLAARMAAADFQVIADGSTTTLASNVPPAQVKRLIGKAGGLGGLTSTAEWSRA